MREQRAKDFAADLTAAAKVFRERQAGGTHTTETVREIVVSPDVRSDIDGLKQRIDDLDQRLSSTPLIPQHTNIEISVPQSLAQRIDALEQHAGASQGLSAALNMVLRLAEESSAKISRLETEAVQTHATVAGITPTLLALAARRAS